MLWFLLDYESIINIYHYYYLYYYGCFYGHYDYSYNLYYIMIIVSAPLSNNNCFDEQPNFSIAADAYWLVWSYLRCFFSARSSWPFWASDTKNKYLISYKWTENYLMKWMLADLMQNDKSDVLIIIITQTNQKLKCITEGEETRLLY